MNIVEHVSLLHGGESSGIPHFLIRVIWFSGFYLLEFFVYIRYWPSVGFRVGEDPFPICWLTFFVLLTVSFALQKLCNFMRSHLSIA